jgi:hypothetical protein
MGKYISYPFEAENSFKQYLKFQFYLEKYRTSLLLGKFKKIIHLSWELYEIRNQILLAKIIVI